MLYLITGPNGGGKTLRSIEKMHELHAQGVNVFAFGYHDLRLDWVDQSLDPRDWKGMPPNSAMFVDEAQKVWRTRRGNAAPPPELMDMEEHRYQGIDMYLITQDPGFLDSHVKGLVTQHQHLVAYGQDASRVFTFNEAQDNPKSITKRASAEFKVWKHPRKYYGCYQSALTHMKKPPVPWSHRRAKLMKYGAGVLAVLLVWYAVYGPTGEADASPAVEEHEVGAVGGLFSRKPARAALSADEFVSAMQPRVAEMPYSAPLYDGRPVLAEPRVYCISSEDSCRCLTEQGTRYLLEQQKCRYIARHGVPYNPYQAPPKGGEGVQGPAPAGASPLPADPLLSLPAPPGGVPLPEAPPSVENAVEGMRGDPFAVRAD